MHIIGSTGRPREYIIHFLKYKGIFFTFSRIQEKYGEDFFTKTFKSIDIFFKTSQISLTHGYIWLANKSTGKSKKYIERNMLHSFDNSNTEKRERKTLVTWKVRELNYLIFWPIGVFIYDA